MARTPNFKLLREYKGLPDGAFVQVVFEDYVPKETKELLGNPNVGWGEERPDTWCYTGKGFMLIPKIYLKEV